MSYYQKHDGSLFPGQIALSDDIHHIQQNIDDAIRNVVKDQYHDSSFILGSRENDFLISPAPKRYGRYIDAQNVIDVADEIWLDIDTYGYKQAILTTKTSVYSFIVRLKNDYSKPQDVTFELWSDEGKIKQQTITMAAHTLNAEYEVVFDLRHFSTQHGNSPDDLDDFHLAFNPNAENKVGIDYQNSQNPNNQSLGATSLYLVVKAIHKATEIIESNENEEEITDTTFMICADAQGQYGQRLAKTADDGKNYESMQYDLCFKEVYSNAPTYLCTGGEAVINGVPVTCNDTHVTVDGASSAGNTKSYISMDVFGQLTSHTSDAYWGTEPDTPIKDFPAGDLIIAIIYTYNGDVKQPKIIQDDNFIENLFAENEEDGEQEYSIIVRQRSHHERLRRLEKELAYQRDIAMPSRLKYNLTGEDVVDNESKSDDGSMIVSSLNTNEDLVNPASISLTDAQKAVDWSKYYVSTDQYGNFVVKSIDAETEQIPITLKETATLEGKTDIKLAQTIVSSENVEIDRDKGIAKLAQHSVETTNEEDTEESVYRVGLNAQEAQETEFNPWDDSAGNRPETKDIKPTERIFTTKKGVNGVNVRSSEYPAMTLYLDKSITLKELIIPVVKFKNVDSVKFHIWKRQGPNNKTNTVWLEKLVYSSESFSLQNAKTKDGYQILDEPFKIAPTGGLKLDQHQYVILVQIFPKSGDGSVYVETYTPKDSTDFLIRYHGSADCSHFRLKDRYREVWYTSATSTKKATVKAYVNNYYTEGTIESGEVIWENSEPIVSVTPIINATTPTGCSIELQANVGNGWKTLTNNQATNITGGTSSFRWRAILKGTTTATPEIKYDEKSKYAIFFSVTKDKPNIKGLDAANEISNKNVLTTKTFYPGDILRKYIGDPNLNTCNKFSNYEWLRIYASETGIAKATIDILGSDKRIKFNNNSENKSDAIAEIVDNVGCSPADDEYDLFTYYYADLTLDDFTRDSVDYSNYDANIEYDEHNLRFKIDTDKAYNDDDVALFTIQDASIDDDVKDVNESLEDSSNSTDENSIIGYDSNQNYLTVTFNPYNPGDNDKYDENTFIWKKTLPGNATIDLTNYSALKIGYNFTEANTTNVESSLDGLALYVSSAIEEVPPSYNNSNTEDAIKQALNKSQVEEYEQISPETLTTDELESYKDKVLKVVRTINNITYTEFYYYLPDEDGIWRRHQYHNAQSFVIYKLNEFKSDKATSESGKNKNNLIISIDKENDNFKYIKEIGLITLDNLNVTNKSKLQFIDIKGVVQGYNVIYSAEKALTSGVNNANIVNPKLYQDPTGQISSITRIYYNRLSTISGTQIGYINNGSITTDANNFGIQFVSDTYIPKDSLFVNLCAEPDGKSPIFTLNMPTLNHVFYDKNLDLANLLDTTSETDKIYQIDNTKDDYKGSAITSTSTTAYNLSSDPVAAVTLPEGKKESDYTGDNKIEYRMSIEPVKTTLNISEDKFEFNLYKERVFVDSKTGQETYGAKALCGKVKAYGAPTNDAGTTSNVTPTVYVSIDDKGFKGYQDNKHVFVIDSNQIGRFGFVFDYAVGQYKVKLGFQGYSVYVKDPNDTDHNEKLVTYRTTENEFTVDIYWRMTNTVNFAQIFKKINEDTQIQSISIETSPKFSEYMNTVRGTEPSNADACMHIFIKNMALYEAEHIPLMHPNVKMKIYSKAADGTDIDVEAVGIRKVGAVIEYK